jgi:hypothetical protein
VHAPLLAGQLLEKAAGPCEHDLGLGIQVAVGAGVTQTVEVAKVVYGAGLGEELAPQSRL